MISSILNMREIGKTIKKAVYIPPIQVEAIFEREATSPTGKMIIKPCNERLMTWWSNSIEHNRSDPLPAPMSLPMIKRTLFTDRGQELHQANPSAMMKSAITGENAEALSSTRWFPQSRTWKRSGKISRRQSTYHLYQWKPFSKGKPHLPRVRW